LQQGILKVDIKNKQAIAALIRSFRFDDSGMCMLRARIGQVVLGQLGIDSKLTAGSMLFRCGKHRVRDTLRFAAHGPNLGGYEEGYLAGHIWIEAQGKIVDFSCGDWMDCGGIQSGREIEIGTMQWDIKPPEYVWGSAQLLRSGWRRRGVPKIGEFWYGDWGSQQRPDLYSFDDHVEHLRPSIERRLSKCIVKTG
jgi:hypothetical protein